MRARRRRLSPAGAARAARQVRAAAPILALALVLTTAAPERAAADRAGDGSMHADERATTFRAGDPVALVFVCRAEEPATLAAEKGVAEVHRRIDEGDCYDARPDTVTARLLGFLSGPYWFGDDATPWSLWAAVTEHGYVVYTLIPDTIGPHEREAPAESET